jgi:hypothetical protein
MLGDARINFYRQGVLVLSLPMISGQTYNVTFASTDYVPTGILSDNVVTGHGTDETLVGRRRGRSVCVGSAGEPKENFPELVPNKTLTT